MSDEPPQPPIELGAAALELLKLANPNGKLAIQMAHAMPYAQQNAYEWMLMNDWLRLIDVCPLAHGPGGVFRVFRAMPVALAFKARMEVY